MVIAVASSKGLHINEVSRTAKKPPFRPEVSQKIRFFNNCLCKHCVFIMYCDHRLNNK